MSVEAGFHEESRLLEQGRREGFALCAFVLGLVSFVNLLGAEKSILAIVFAAFAIRPAAHGKARRFAWVAVVAAVLHLCTLGLVLVLYRDELARLVELLRRLA